MQIDIFDDQYRFRGTADKGEAHRLGLWHRVFTCLIINPERGCAYLQRKVPGQYAFDRPDFLDISVGGHYEAGERIEDGVREIREEVGLAVAFSDLISLGVRQTAATLVPNYIANEFQHIFLLPVPHCIEDLELPGGEVRALVEVDIEEAIALLLGDRKEIPARSRKYAFEGEQMVEEITITQDDFPPSYLALDQFFLRLFIAASRLARGDDRRRIFW